MSASDAEIVAGALSHRLTARMEELGVSIRKLAETIKISYEHARKVVNGESVPSRHILPEIAEALKLDLLELEPLANHDRARKKFPSVPLGPKAGNPELEPLDNIWNDLSEDQKEDLILLAQLWARRERKRKRNTLALHAGQAPENL